MIACTELELTEEDHDKAFTEVSFLLDIFVKTIDSFIGRSAPSLGVTAGRNTAKKLPIYLKDPTPEEALSELTRLFSDGFEITYEIAGDEAVLQFRQCPIRDVCQNRGLQLGQHTCEMFHYYFAGILAELTGRMVRPVSAEAGPRCTVKLSFGKAK